MGKKSREKIYTYKEVDRPGIWKVEEIDEYGDGDTYLIEVFELELDGFKEWGYFHQDGSVTFLDNDDTFLLTDKFTFVKPTKKREVRIVSNSELERIDTAVGKAWEGFISAQDKRIVVDILNKSANM